MPADGSLNKGHHHGISRISVNRTLESIYILVDMHSHKTITIMTSPTAATKPLPGCTSPTSKGPVQYRIEERSRTVYVTSDLSPSQWEHSLDQIFSLAEEAETTQAPTHLTQTLSVDAQVLTSEDSTATGVADARAQSPRNINYRSRRSEFVPTATLGTYTDSPRRSSPRTMVRPRILFYHKHDPHYGFTNFSEHPVVYKGKRYPTSEHLFQSFKFQDHRPNLAEHIRTCSERPSVAFSEARRFQPEVRQDWKQVNVQKMDEALWHKFTQHSDLKSELLATGDAELVEDSDKDAFWGVGPDGRGRNELGKALERLRAKLEA